MSDSIVRSAATSPYLADVVIPVRNEEQNILRFYNRIRTVPAKLNLIFVDNASTDTTVPILKTLPDVTIIQHATDEGYGGSIVDGIRHSHSRMVIIIDADCEYPPEAIAALLNMLETAEVVYGSRFLGRQAGQMPLMKKVGNQIISGIFNLLFHQQVTDLYTGFKGLRRSALDGVELTQKGFEHVLEMAVKMSRKGFVIREYPVEFSPRQAGASRSLHRKTFARNNYRVFREVLNIQNFCKMDPSYSAEDEKLRV